MGKWDNKRKSDKKWNKRGKTFLKIFKKISNILIPRKIRNFLGKRKLVRTIQKFVQKHIVILTFKQWVFVNLLAYSNSIFFAPYILNEFRIMMIPKISTPDESFSLLIIPVAIITPIILLFLIFAIDDDDDDDEPDETPKDDGGIPIEIKTVSDYK